MVEQEKDGHADSIGFFSFFSVLLLLPPFNLIYRDSIVCQGICKILIDYIQGIDTTREQASQAPVFFCSRPLLFLIHFFGTNTMLCFLYVKQQQHLPFFFNPVIISHGVWCGCGGCYNNT